MSAPPRPSRAHIVELTLQGLAEGRVQIEDFVRAAVRSGGRLQQWLERELALSIARERYLPLVRRRSLPHSAWESALASARRKFARRAGVDGVSWGVKYVGGIPTSHGSLIVWVREKKPTRNRRSALPRSLRIRQGRRTIEIPIDVQNTPVVERQWTGEVRPGDSVRVVVGGNRGTLSAVLTSGAVVFSGHVADSLRQPVFLQLEDGENIQAGEVKKRITDTEVDAALGGALPPEDIPFASSPPAAVRELDPSEHSIAVNVMCLEKPKPTWVDAVGMPAHFNDGTQMTELVRLAGEVTVKGDSGAPVLDTSGRLLGFVIGASQGHTVVIPAGRVLDAVA